MLLPEQQDPLDSIPGPNFGMSLPYHGMKQILCSSFPNRTVVVPAVPALKRCWSKHVRLTVDCVWWLAKHMCALVEPTD